MPILHIEHPVGDFDTWKKTAFDADPIGRAKSGVRRYSILRSADDPNFVIVELEFATKQEAERMHGALRKLWQNPLVQIGGPTVRIMEAVETNDY
jgi:hypothetical protein